MLGCRRIKGRLLIFCGLILLSGLLVSHQFKLEDGLYAKGSHALSVLRTQSTAIHSNNNNNTSDIPLIYFVTPTVARTEQKADLTRLSHTLRLVPRLHWLVVEDSESPSRLVEDLLAKCTVPYTHLAVHTTTHEVTRGVDQRNAGLNWIAEHGESPSVFYPGDDDNTYDLQLFEEMRYTKKVAVWPVGLVGHAEFQRPVVENGKVVGWAAGWGTKRKFAIDMAGFAVNTELLNRPNPPRFSKKWEGLVETNFLQEVNITLADLEPKADNCSKVLVWHTRTEKSNLEYSSKLKELLDRYNLSSIEV